MFKLYFRRVFKTLHNYRFVSLISTSLLLGACSTLEYSAANGKTHNNPFKDELFPTYQSFNIETEDEVFSLGEDALVYMEESINYLQDPKERIDALVDDLFTQSNFKLLYVNDANTIASETFKTKSANCLSMSIMAYSLAREADLEVRFQEVIIPEYWTNREGFSLLNGHINLRISPRVQSNIHYFNRTGITVDFDPLSANDRFTNLFITKNKVLAMYYNNKGADAFLRGSHDEAYAYFKASATTSPTFDDVWVNLGYLYKVRGDLELAQRTYEHALALDDDNYTGWENLAILLDGIGEKRQAKEIKEKVERKRFENPYYHLMLGDQEFNRGNWRAAIKYYRKAIRLDDGPHEFYFGLAKSYYKLGNIERSEEYLRLAKRHSSLEQDKQHYQGKLNLFSNL
ncbi:tetratricopeptide repeat protein [Alteromonadaceae bacterium M269]|nr:tetratricopeptide repeat protein [Alteromonadaceae bacterium M269]